MDRLAAKFESKSAPEINPAELLSARKKEILQKALRTEAGVAGLKSWRALDNEGVPAKRTRRLLDELSAFDGLRKQNPQATEQLKKHLSKMPIGTGRVGELQSLLSAHRSGTELPETKPEVRRIFNGLMKAASSEGQANAVGLLCSENVGFGDKRKWFDAHILPAIKFLEKRDMAEARQKAKDPLPDEIMEQKEQAPENNLPPPDSNELSPSMDEMQKAKEGEAGAYFTIAPYYGGYYREGHFSCWNSKKLKWERGGRDWQECEPISIDEKTRRVFFGAARGSGVTALPMPYGFAPDIDSLKILSGGKANIVRENGGGYAIKAKGGGPVSFSVEIGRAIDAENIVSPEKLQMDVKKLSRETEAQLQKIKSSGDQALAQARKLKAYVRTLLKYSNESTMNAAYRAGDPAGYFSRIEQHKKADCDVANTFFVALLSRLGIEARLVSGHYITAKNRSGCAVISSGTGHAWSEVFDNGRWHRLDATPPGDPNMDDEETDEKPDEETGEGDFGEQDVEEISDQELAKMIQEAEETLREKKRAPEEARELSFAEEAGCSAEEARRIIKQIETARESRDKKGRLIRGRLIGEFQKIIQENLLERLRYKSPVRLSTGQDLIDPVEAALDIKAGEADPSGFGRYERKIKREQVYGGFDVIFVADKSGSMSETDAASGRAKWEAQQIFIFLFLDALHAAKDSFRRIKIKLISPLDVRTGLVSFCAGGATVELPLGADWSPKEQFKIWKALQENIGGGTPDHLGLAAAQKIIKADMATNSRNKKAKERLRLVLVSADGGSDDQAATLAAKESLKELAIVKAAGIGSGARAVEAAYCPDGKNLQDFNAVPDWAAEAVISEARALYPRKIKK